MKVGDEALGTCLDALGLQVVAGLWQFGVGRYFGELLEEGGGGGAFEGTAVEIERGEGQFVDGLLHPLPPELLRQLLLTLLDLLHAKLAAALQLLLDFGGQGESFLLLDDQTDHTAAGSHYRVGIPS